MKVHDVEFQLDINMSPSAYLLYSPFELFTNFRIRNQIILLLDIIQGFKKTFNKEFKQFIIDRNILIEKFNANKLAIELIKDSLTDVPIESYDYAINPYEDNEWVNKVDEADIKIPRYLSKEEKRRLEEERIREEERLKAHKGDTRNII